MAALSLALGMATLISAVAKVTSPIVWVLTASTNGILRLCGIDPNSEDDEVSEEEIRMMVDVGNQKGVIDLQERDIIQNVFEFDDLTVGRFATHRTEMTVLWLDETPEQWEKTIHDSRYSRYPVCNETVDDIVGILDAKDYFRLSDKSRENVMEQAVKPAYFVPESVFADVLFKQLKNNHTHMAVVLDEYGGVLGIVTMYDLLEQLVGDLDDDSRGDEPEDIQRLDSSTWQIRGTALLEDVAEQLNVKLPVDEYDTFGGFVFGNYGLVPEDGTVFEIDLCSLHIKVNEIQEHRLEKATVCLEVQ